MEEQESKQETEFDEAYADKRYRKKPHRLTGSMAAKVIVFFLLAFFCFIGLSSGIGVIIMADSGYYSLTLNEVLTSELSLEMQKTTWNIQNLLIQEKGNTEEVQSLCDDRNIDAELLWVDESNREKLIWTSGKNYDTGIYRSSILDLKALEGISVSGHKISDNEIYLLKIYIDPEVPKGDNVQRIVKAVRWVYGYKYDLIGLAVVCLLFCIVCFVFLMCSSGHHNGQEGVVPGVLTGVYLDVLTAVYGAVAMFFFFLVYNVVESVSEPIVGCILLAVSGVVLVLWLTQYFMELALRAKLGKFWRHSLIFVVLRGTWRILRFLCMGFFSILRGIPLVITVVIAYLGLCILEFIGIVLFVEAEGAMLWFLEKLFLMPIILYIALVCKKLLNASRALAEGQEGYRVDTSKMFGEFREHGENLNSLGQGISKAVAERMKSEHLKTELITNVSHDIKTPLTSIINYADLICEEAAVSSEKDDKILEYAQVLLRQSRRLKKLLEDLVEASKATTGNLEVNLEPCEVGVILSQAVGEYQQRMEEKELELIVRQPEETVKIMADGRHLWRVFDNLLNNISKYAQENTRVYLSVEVKEYNVLIIFRNMSKYPLDISAEELMERFVRGDKSRNMEGNGLGLSIARSLIDLQNGQMEIVTDGDLFKVILIFSIL